MFSVPSAAKLRIGVSSQRDRTISIFAMGVLHVIGNTLKMRVL